jgi:hypothetical protein
MEIGVMKNNSNLPSVIMIRILVVIGIASTIPFFVYWKYVDIGGYVVDAVWFSSPYLILAYFNEFRPTISRRPNLFVLVTAGIVAMGLYSMVEIVFIDQDPLGIIAMYVVAFIQVICVLIAQLGFRGFFNM